jgi:DNA primase
MIEEIKNLSKELSQESIEYLKKRKISPIITKKYVKEIKEGTYHRNNHYILLFPFIDHKGQITMAKVRRIKNIEDGQQKAKLIKDSKKHLIGTNEIKNIKDITIIVEGEIDFLTLKTTEYRYPEIFRDIQILALPDATYTANEEETKLFSKKIISLIEHDQAGIRAIKRLTETLKDKTIIPVKLKIGKDINDFAQAKGHKAIAKMIEIIKTGLPKN